MMVVTSRATGTPLLEWAQSLTSLAGTPEHRLIRNALRRDGQILASIEDLAHRCTVADVLGGRQTPLPLPRAAPWLGHPAQEHLRTYAHVVMDRTEVDYKRLSGER